jgi:hypothetical protein
VTITAPPNGPPDLAPLEIQNTNTAHTGIAIRTSTSAPPRTVPTGDHRVSATVGGVAVAAQVLQDIPESALATPPPAAVTEAVLERGIRAAGRSPLVLWFTRPVAASPVEVAVRVIDPLGRVTERTETVPGWTPPPPYTLTLVDVVAIIGRGVSVTVSSNAPVAHVPPYRLAVKASQRSIRPLPPRFPLPSHAALSAAIALPDIPRSAVPRPSGGIQFGWRAIGASRAYDIWIPLSAPLSANIALIAPDGGRVSVTTTA